jgi:hypothetical protein
MVSWGVHSAALRDDMAEVILGVEHRAGNASGVHRPDILREEQQGRPMPHMGSSAPHAEQAVVVTATEGCMLPGGFSSRP